jgi:hypothetical protein
MNVSPPLLQSKITVFWDVMQCGLVESYHFFKEPAVPIFGVDFSETLATFYLATQRNIPEVTNLNIHSHEILKSHNSYFLKAYVKCNSVMISDISSVKMELLKARNFLFWKLIHSKQVCC